MKTAEDILKDKKFHEMVTADQDTIIIDAVKQLATKKIGAMLVKKNDQIIGIWTERDFLCNMLETGFDPKTARIGDYMKTDLIFAAHDTSIIKLEEIFLGRFIRHILIKKKKKYVGLLSIGDVIRASLLVKDNEIKSLNKIASWEYYENWKGPQNT
jgi:predicted transcriptional regulator